MKKLSVIVPCYGTEEYVEKCIRSIFNQTYKNIEIIAVNDCSKGNMKDILNNLSMEDSRIKVIENDKNKGLFHTRIIGSKIATGDYIAFVDSDDYIDNDFYRLLINSLENNNSDVVISNYVRKNNEKKYVAGLTFSTNDSSYSGEEFYKMFYEQTGRNIRYHLLWNKVIKMEIWKKILPYVESIKERIVMTEDFAFSALLLYYAKKVTFCDEAIYYYTVNDTQSTNTKNISVSKINNNIKDIISTFSFVEDFLKKKDVYDKYKKHFKIWRIFYISIHINTYLKLKKISDNIEKLDFDYENDIEYKEFKKIQEYDKSWDNYHDPKTPYDEGFNEIKRAIIDENTKVVSFDMFDTLIYRPFLIPNEMFVLLNSYFRKIFNSLRVIDFSKIRIDSEAKIREKKYKNNICEVNIDEIYEEIQKQYNLDGNKLEKIKEKELEMELHFCNRRNSGYELYLLAKQLNKRVILTSDIYLPRDILIKILEKNGYSGFDKLYISSELLKTKSNGNLFEHIIKEEKTKNIFHIGDNLHSDVNQPLKYGIKSAQLPKATDVMMGFTNKNVRHCGDLYKNFLLFNHDLVPYEENYGVRCSLAIIANYYFDNPFRPYNPYSDFNADPYFIGYYALGMQTISMCKWLIDDAKNNKINSISFMARDGFQPYEAAKIYQKFIKDAKEIDLNYIYVSRKSLMPLLLKDKVGLSLIETYLNYNLITPRELIKQLESVLKYDEVIEKKLSKIINLDEKFENKEMFNNTLSIIYDNCFDQKKYEKYFNLCKKYFEDNFTGKASTFDIGYSGKPEAIISSIINKDITTYFIHTNNSSAYKNIENTGSKLKTFYEFKPTLTGTIRELLVSAISPSCIGYKEENKKIVPVFSDSDKYNYFNIDMINKIQQGSLDFVRNFCDQFKDYIQELDLNRYYMSIPLEYYYHYTQLEDRIPTKNLIFEDNVNHYIELNDFIFNRYKEYTKEFCKGQVPSIIEKSINYELPKNRLIRIGHYLLNDKNEFKKKWNEWNEKKYDRNSLPNSKIKRVIYYMIFDRKSLFKRKR